MFVSADRLKYTVYSHIHHRGVKNTTLDVIRGPTTSLKFGGPFPWSRILIPFCRKKSDRSIQFGAVGYIITLYSSKSYVKSWVSVKNFFGGVRTPQPPSGCAHGCHCMGFSSSKYIRTRFRSSLCLTPLESVRGSPDNIRLRGDTASTLLILSP